MPVTQWFTDTVPAETGDAITVVVGDQQARIPISDLDRGDRVRAVLDCTGGWYAAQDWAGVRLDRLLGEVTDETCPTAAASTSSPAPVTAAASRSATRRPCCWRRPPPGSRSRTGTERRCGWSRPGRRGFWWVKWVERIEVVDAPWWRQPPFPLQ